MRFAPVPAGTGAVDARRMRGLHDVVLDLEDEPLLIQAAIPEVGAVMRRHVDGFWHMPYDAALLVAGGFVEAPTRAPAAHKLWVECMLAPHRLQLAWRAALPLVFEAGVAPADVQARSAFGWYADAKELRPRLPEDARVWDPDADFYSLEGVPALATSAVEAVVLEREALLNEWPAWLRGLECKRGSAVSMDGSLDALVFLEYVCAPRCLFSQRGLDSNFTALLAAIEAAAADASLAPASRRKMRAPALAASAATFIRDIFPDPVFAAYLESAEAREAQLQFLCEVAAIEAGHGVA